MFLQIVAKFVKLAKGYTTVRFAPLKDAHVRGARVRHGIGFGIFNDFCKPLQICQISERLYYGEICAAERRARQGG